MTDTPDINPSPIDSSSRPRGWWIPYAISVVAIIVVVLALLPPANRNRTVGRRSQCKNNLKQIGLALHNYHDTYKAFPPAYTVDSNGKPLHSWRTLLLPFVDQHKLYNSIDLSKPWDDPANLKVCEDAYIDVYRCPSPNMPKHCTTYLAIVGADCFFDPTRGRKLSDIADRSLKTLAVVEAAREQAVPWMSPLDAYEALVLAIDPRNEQSHSGGAHALAADGSVRFISGTTPKDKLRASLTIARHETTVDW